MTDNHQPAITPSFRKYPAMYNSNNPFKPVPQRPERIDETWRRRADPVAHEAVQEVSRRGY